MVIRKHNYICRTVSNSALTTMIYFTAPKGQIQPPIPWCPGPDPPRLPVPLQHNQDWAPQDRPAGTGGQTSCKGRSYTEPQTRLSPEYKPNLSSTSSAQTVRSQTARNNVYSLNDNQCFDNRYFSESKSKTNYVVYSILSILVCFWMRFWILLCVLSPPFFILNVFPASDPLLLSLRMIPTWRRLLTSKQRRVYIMWPELYHSLFRPCVLIGWAAFWWVPKSHDSALVI